MDLGKLRELSVRRRCLVCGAQFETVAATKDTPEVTALQQFSEHSTIHQADGAAWTKVYDSIRASKENAG